ncbi:hydroxylamine reductase [Falsiporphyromonas endometrii]|uniref:Hydroxylamine reductase n=1 Tax=Falsiporphyromonas endometrii TaxID=1387297 RepID=A0ABV9K6J1_9PORP
MEQNQMFCYQCQETANGKACILKGICGKNSATSASMDLLLFSVRAISIVADALRNNGVAITDKVNHFITDALFTTITNANFDEKSIIKKFEQGLSLRDKLKLEANKHNISLPIIDELDWNGSFTEYDQKAKEVGVLREKDINLRSLKELILYGLKGMAAYLEHAMRLGYDDYSIHAFIQHTIKVMTVDKVSMQSLLELTIQTGEYGVKVMALLDQANTNQYGHPRVTSVNIGVGDRPGILISGHDLHDMEQLLKQTEGTGVDVYTHGEMLPANYYPKFKRFKHFIGNYGNAWWKQREEFSKFNGPILFTTNCIVPPTERDDYKDRIFTSNATGFPGCRHILSDKDGHKDYSEIIELAKHCKAPTEIETGTIVGGFAHHQVFQLLDKVVAAVKDGSIKRFIVMAGCDGRMRGRSYYTEFAEKLPKDCVILTAGCAKYRYNKLPLGDIAGIPRVLDAGQCNDSYSLAVIAMKLKEVFALNDINDLPISYNIAWYEQKAVIVLLALLSLGVKNIHLGPSLPAFLSPDIATILIEEFGIAGINTVEEDMKIFGL